MNPPRLKYVRCRRWRVFSPPELGSPSRRIGRAQVWAVISLAAVSAVVLGTALGLAINRARGRGRTVSAPNPEEEAEFSAQSGREEWRSRTPENSPGTVSTR